MKWIPLNLKKELKLINYNYNAIMFYSQVRLWYIAIYDIVHAVLQWECFNTDYNLNSLNTPQLSLTCNEDFWTKLIVLYLHNSGCVCAVRNHNLIQCWTSSMMPYRVIIPPLLNPFPSLVAVNHVTKRKFQQFQQEVMETHLQYFEVWKTEFGNSSSKRQNSIS